jgi:hypothetical protein
LAGRALPWGWGRLAPSPSLPGQPRCRSGWRRLTLPTGLSCRSRTLLSSRTAAGLRGGTRPRRLRGIRRRGCRRYRARCWPFGSRTGSIGPGSGRDDRCLIICPVRRVRRFRRGDRTGMPARGEWRGGPLGGRRRVSVGRTRRKDNGRIQPPIRGGTRSVAARGHRRFVGRGRWLGRSVQRAGLGGVHGHSWHFEGWNDIGANSEHDRWQRNELNTPARRSGRSTRQRR